MKTEVNSEVVEEFVELFCSQLNKSDSYFKKFSNFGEDTKEAYLPKAFSGLSAAVTSFYSKDRKHILIIFQKSDQYKFYHQEITGNVFDVFDFMNLWGRSSAFRVENSSVIVKNTTVTGMRPVDIYGKAEFYLEELQMAIPYPNGVKISLDYAMVFSIDVFLEKLSFSKDFADSLVLAYSNYYETNKQKFNPESDEGIAYKRKLMFLKEEMQDYFFTSKYKETEIDNFIEKNPIIIHKGLGLIEYHSPMLLEDIHGQYNQNLKPDLVGFDPIEEHWKIVDYKLPWKKLVRAEGSVRASVSADITQLHSQLSIYREYFFDYRQRAHTNEKYKVSISKHPPTIGVIGTITPESRTDLNKARYEYPNWFRIISYDEIYKKVCEHIDFVTKVQ